MKTLTLAVYLWAILAFLALGARAADSIKPNALSSITNAGLATDDLLLVFDTSAGITKKMQIGQADLRYTRAFLTNACASGQYARQISNLGLLSCAAISVGQVSGAFASASFTDTAVTSKLITGYASGAGAVAGTDTILQAINKLNGNIALVKTTADAALPATGVGLVDGWGFHVVGVASNQEYFLQYAVPYGGTINSISFNATSGTATFSLEINGTPVTGCSSVSATATDSVVNCTAANTFGANADIRIAISASSSWTDFIGTVKYTR